MDDVRYRILVRIGESCGAAPIGDYPAMFGLAREQMAASVVTCGTLLLDLLISDPPVKDDAKRERKALVKALDVDNGVAASVFLAHALARFEATDAPYAAPFLEGDQGFTLPPAFEQAIGLLNEHYPLNATAEAALAHAGRFYPYLDLEPGSLPPEQAPPVEDSTGWIMYVAGERQVESPEEMKNVVEGHFMTARNAFRDEASMHGLGLVLGSSLADSGVGSLADEDVGLDRALISVRVAARWAQTFEAYRDLLVEMSE
jgi:hypothetical protein